MPAKKGTKKASKKVVAQELKIEKDSKDSIKTKEATLSLVRINNFKNLSKSKGLVVLGVILLIVVGYIIFKWLVIAWVDGRPVTLIEFRNQLSQGSGSDLRDQMIAERLVENEAKKRNISIAENEVNDEVKKLEDQQGGREALLQQLEANGLDEQTFKKQFKVRLLIQKMFDNEASVSAEDVDKYIEDNKDSLVQATDTAKLKKDVETQLKQLKIDEVFRNWMQEALKSSRVIRS